MFRVSEKICTFLERKGQKGVKARASNSRATLGDEGVMKGDEGCVKGDEG